MNRINRIKDNMFEIIILIFALTIILVFIIDKDVSKSLVTNFTVFRPEYSFSLAIAFVAISFILGILFIMQAKKKKLKSTKKTSVFANTVIRSHKTREMSQTQVAFEEISSAGISSMDVDIRGEIDVSNQNIIELYFVYENGLNI